MMHWPVSAMRVVAFVAASLLMAWGTWLVTDTHVVRRAGRLAGSSRGRVLLDMPRLVLARMGARRRARTSTRRRESDIARSLSALASELEAGQLPSVALVEACGEPAAWPRTRAAAQAHGDVVAALRADAEGRESLVHLAACWEVARESGAGLAASITRLAESTRRAQDVRHQLQAQLAGPRATARMLGLLPVVGIGLGALMGADPLTWLLGTVPGIACLITGILLTTLGMWWTNRIAASVEARI